MLKTYCLVDLPQKHKNWINYFLQTCQVCFCFNKQTSAWERRGVPLFKMYFCVVAKIILNNKQTERTGTDEWSDPRLPCARSTNCLFREQTVRDLFFKPYVFLDYFSLDFSTFVDFDIDCNRFSAADTHWDWKHFRSPTSPRPWM